MNNLTAEEIEDWRDSHHRCQPYFVVNSTGIVSDMMILSEADRLSRIHGYAILTYFAPSGEPIELSTT